MRLGVPGETGAELIGFNVIAAQELPHDSVD